MAWRACARRREVAAVAAQPLPRSPPPSRSPLPSPSSRCRRRLAACITSACHSEGGTLAGTARPAHETPARPAQARAWQRLLPAMWAAPPCAALRIALPIQVSPPLGPPWLRADAECVCAGIGAGEGAAAAASAALPPRRRARRLTGRWRNAAHRPPSGSAIGGEFGALPLDPQVRATPPQAVGAARPVAHVRLFSRSPLRALVRAAVAGRRLSAANAAVGAASVNVPPYAVRARRRHLPPHPPHGMSVLERGCVAARARRRRSARYALLAARRAHASAALCSGSDRRCPLRRRVPQRGARAPPPLHPPLLVCAGVWFRCLARTFVRCLARCVVLATPRTHACAPCAQAPTAGGRGGAHPMAQPRPSVATRPASAVRLCATTRAITPCVSVAARRVRRHTRHSLRYGSLPFERARPRIRPPMLKL